jgi:hypothetical protein
MAAIREESYKRKMENTYSKKILECLFKEGDYVLRSNTTSKAEPASKLAPNWEGPYIIHKVFDKGAYILAQLDGKVMQRTWNGAQLRRCYI